MREFELHLHEMYIIKTIYMQPVELRCDAVQIRSISQAVPQVSPDSSLIFARQLHSP